jgi:hypothetical protein
MVTILAAQGFLGLDSRDLKALGLGVAVIFIGWAASELRKWGSKRFGKSKPIATGEATTLMGLRAEGQRLRDQAITVDQLPRWQEKVQDWFWSVARLLEEHFEVEDVRRFRHDWLTVKPDKPGAVNDDHARLRQTLDARLAILDQILGRES